MRRSRLSFIAAVLALFVVVAPPTRAAEAFADPDFEERWTVDESYVPNYWGPLAAAGEGRVAPSGGAAAPTQLFDKGQMEFAAGEVVSGPLVVEMRTGAVRTGDGATEAREPARLNIAGDPGDSGPTYADLALLPAFIPEPGGGVGIAPVLFRDGQFAPIPLGEPGAGLPKPDPNGPVATYVGDEGRGYGGFVLQFFHDGITALPGGYAVTGLPVAPFFLADVSVAGVPTRVIVQPFERRVLTYTETNPPETRVEFGNVGRHYAAWRYGSP